LNTKWVRLKEERNYEMDEKSKSFVVKPTLFMVLMSEKGTNNIRKIYFLFSDRQFWSIELDGESVVTLDHDINNRETMWDADKENSLVQHTMLGEVPLLPNEEVKALFITLWTKAAASKDYDKKEWMELDGILRGRGYSL